MKTYHPNQEVITRTIEGQLVLYDPGKDAVHTLNPTAQLIWENINKPAQQIVSTMQTTYQVSEDIAQRDVTHVLEQFESLGLIQAHPSQ